MKGFIVNQKNKIHQVWGNKADRVVMLAIAAFLLFTVIKLTLFNFFLLPNQNVGTFLYKLGITLLFVLILYPLLFKIRSRVIFTVFYLIQVVYIVVNISYYLYFHSYLHISQTISLFYEGFTATQNASAPVSPILLVAFIDLPFFIYLLVRYARAAEIRYRLRSLFTALLIFSLIVGVGSEVVNFTRHSSIVHVYRSMFLGESKVVAQYGTLTNNLMNLYASRSEKAMMTQLRYGKEQSVTQESKDKPNFAIIQVESLDANVISKQYKGQYIAPYLHEMAQNNIYYPYNVSYHLGGGTSDCEFSVVNSLHPLIGYPSIKLSGYDYPNSFVSRLRDASYETLAFHGNVGRFYNRDVAFPKMGFQEFYDIDKMKMKDKVWGAPDGDVFDFSLSRLDEAKQPFLSYVITMSSHGPFNLVNGYYNNENYQDISSTVTKNYFNSMSYVDQSIHNYVEAIRQKYPNTYIFIFGDHAPNIQNDTYQQASIMLEGKRYEFVPLIILTPDHQVKTGQTQVTSFLDIAPTVLHSSGIPFRLKSDGEDLIRSKVLVNKIPVRGTNFDRGNLFKKVTKEFPSGPNAGN